MRQKATTVCQSPKHRITDEDLQRGRTTTGVKQSNLKSHDPSQTHSVPRNRKSNNTISMAKPKHRRANTRLRGRFTSQDKVEASQRSGEEDIEKTPSRSNTGMSSLIPGQASESVAPPSSPTNPSNSTLTGPAKKFNSRVSFDLASEKQIAALYKSLAPPAADQPSLIKDISGRFEKFTLFPKLPAEVRVKIWRSALCEYSSITKVDFDTTPHFNTEQVTTNRRGRPDHLRGLTRDVHRIECKFDLNTQDGPNSALLAVCVESRTEALKVLAHYKYIQMHDNPSSKKVWFRPDTDTVYFDQNAVLALTILASRHSSPSKSLHNARKITRVGIDHFSIGTKGMMILLEQIFKQARGVVPINPIEGNLGMNSSMSEENLCGMFKKLIVAPFLKHFRAVVPENTEYSVTTWGVALDRVCREIGWRDFQLKRSPFWDRSTGQRYQVGEMTTYGR